METYSEAKRDSVELELANRRELLHDRRHGLEIFQYWLRQSNTIEMVLVEDGFYDREFPIPNDAVLEAQSHPEFYAAMNNKGVKTPKGDT